MNHTRDMLHQPFSRRHGYAPLPEAMRLEHLSEEFRIEIWNLVRSSLIALATHSRAFTFFGDEAGRFLEGVLGRLTGRPEDEINTDYEATMAFVKKVVLEGNFFAVLDFLELFSDQGASWRPFAEQVHDLFEHHAAPYRFDISRPPCHFIPRGSKEQGEAIQRAVDTSPEKPLSSRCSPKKNSHAAGSLQSSRRPAPWGRPPSSGPRTARNASGPADSRCQMKPAARRSSH